MSPEKKPQHFYLIDGSGFIFRAYHAMPPLTRADGTPVGAVLGFCNMISKLQSETDADHLAVVFDTARITFRTRLYAEYKAHRPETPDDLVPQFALVREATDAFGICRIEKDDFEADDLIATYADAAVKAGARVTIVSSDKDLMQLVNDKVELYDPIKERPIRAPEVKEKFGVGPDKVIDVQALLGDSVDNVPGVRGIGEDAASRLIQEFGNLEAVLKLAAKPDEFKKYADAEAKKIEPKIFKLTKHAFNLGSPKELGQVLFEELKLPGGKQGKTGAYSVNADILGELAKTHEIADLILRWRFWTRTATTYADLLAEYAADAILSKKLVTLDRKVPLPCPLSALALQPIDPAKVTAFMQQQGFRSLLSRIQAKLGVKPSAAPAPKLAPIPESKALAPLAEAAHYELIQDLPDLQRWIEEATTAGQVAVDTETTSLDAWMAELVGISLAIVPGRACYIPVGHKNPGQGALDLAGAAAPAEAPRQLPLKIVIEKLKPLLEDPAVLKIGQNIKYDMEVLSRHGVAVAPTDCTMLISFVLEGGLHGQGLDELAKLHFNHDMIKYKDVAGSGKSHIGFAAVALDKARDYAAEDADFTLRLHKLLKPRLAAEHKLAFYETIERPMSAVVAAMEEAGIKVDRAELQRLSEDFAKRCAEFEVEIHRLAGHPFNVASPQQLGKVLFEELKLDSGRKTKTGAYTTDAAMLEELASAHPLPARVLDWRELSKLKSTYADALVAQINPRTGRVHTSYSLVGAATGRLASSDPNLQNIPIRTEEGRKIRHAFIAEAGHLLISADYSQIELRLAAHVAGVGPLKEAFRQGLDIHALTASEVFGVPVKGMDPAIRRRAKAINFGILYGISAFGLGNQIDVPQAEAAQYIKAYFERFPGIRDYMERTKEFAREHGYVETLFGRRCYLTGIKDTNQARRAFSERAAINAPLQGAAADIIKRAMRRVPPALEKAGLQARMLLQVHDELVLEAPAAEAEKTAALVKSVMEGAHLPAVELSVPLVVETGMARHWDEAH